MKRPSQNILDHMRRDLASTKQRLEQARLIAEGLKTPFWRSVKWMVDRKIKECQDVILDQRKHDMISDAQRTILTTRWGDCTLFCSMVEDFASDLNNLENQYATNLEKFKDYERKLRARSPV